MKRILVLLVMAVAFGTVVDGREAKVAEYSDIHGHYLKREWRKYERISRRDRPEKEIALLAFIKEQALKNKLDLDYYDAAVRIGTTQVRENWKLRDSLRTGLMEEFIKAGKPIMAYSLVNSEALGRQKFDELRFAEDNRETLKKGKNSVFWRLGYWREGYVCVPEFIPNDYEYILWRCLSDTSAHDEALAALKDAIADVLSEYASSHSDEAAGRRAAEIADGVRLWLVLQKETQDWDTDPAFVNALCSVRKGSADLLSTRVVTLTQRVLKPFGDVKASGNGFSIEKSYYIGGKEIGQGDTVRRGDRIRAVYTVQNAENRSFIRLTAPREASLVPVDQLSGIYNLSFAPLTIDGWYHVSPCGYRDVKPDRTVFYFDTYPEGCTTVTEDFFVTQTGTFQAPVPEIESLYAPHYRANAAAASYGLKVK